MIVVKVELWPHGYEENTQEIGRVFVANVGGDHRKGDYLVAAMRRGEERCPWSCGDGANATATPVREGKVSGHARLSLPVLTLIRKALAAMEY